MGTFGTLRLGLGFGGRSLSFVGPLDAFDGQLYAVLGPHRALSSYAGPCWRVRRSIDAGEEDVGFASDGWVDSAWLLSVAAGGSLYIVRDYDKSGAGRDGLQTSIGSQWRIVNAGVLDVGANGKPAPFLDGANDFLEVQNAVGFARAAAAITVAGIVRATGSGTQYAIAISRADGAFLRSALGYASGTTATMDARSTDAGALSTASRSVASGSWQRLVGRARFAAGFTDLAVSGALTSAALTPAQSSPDTNSFNAPRLGSHPNGTIYLTGQMSQVVMSRSELDIASLDAALAQMTP